MYAFVERVDLPDGGTPEELQRQLRAIANTHIPKTPEAPSFEVPIPTEEGYQLDVSTPGNCRGVMVRVHPDCIELVYLSESQNEPPVELRETTFSEAARQVLLANGWDDSPICATVSKSWTYQELGATDPFAALVCLLAKCDQIDALLEESGAGYVEYCEDRAPLAGDEMLEGMFGSTWARIKINDGPFEAATLYFYPGVLQVVFELPPDAEIPEDDEVQIEVALWLSELIAIYLTEHYPGWDQMPSYCVRPN